MEATLSPYKIMWAEFTPTTGRVVTKHDQKVLGAITALRRQKYYRRHFASKQQALEFINTFSSKLNKRYMVRLFTDKQFGMAKQKDGYAIPYTKKQLAEVYYVG